MNITNQIPIHMIQKVVNTMLYPPQNENKDESDVYRWKSSFDFKKNINKMYYTNLSDRYELQDYLSNGYNEVQKIVEFLQTVPIDMNNMTQTQKIKESNKRKANQNQSPRIYSLMKKYKNLLNHQQFQKDFSQNQKPPKSPNNSQSTSSTSSQRDFQKIKLDILKKHPNQFNGHQLTKYFQDLITNHHLFSFKTEQEVVFQEIVKKISPRMNYNVYLPTMLKVVMANVNWIDRQNDTASIALKIEVKVNVPGISQYPYFYQQVFKEKMKISLKTQNRSNVFNESIKFNHNNNEMQTFEIINDKIQKKKIKSTYYNDCQKFFQTGYKWLNYDKPTYIYQKRVQDFEGFMLEVSVNDIRVLVSNENQMSPFEMIDLYGIVQLEPIMTQMKDWVQILYEKHDQNSLRKFLVEASPKVTIKFNLISLYQSIYDVPLNEKISLNHIRSFDTVESDGYKLAQNLMFLQTTNQRESRYQLCKFSKCRGSYKWYRGEKLDVTQQIKDRMKKISLKQEEIKEEKYYQLNHPAQVYSYLKIQDLRFSHNKYSLQFNNTENIQQTNKKFSNYFTTIRKNIYEKSSPKKVSKNQNQTYYPENFTYNDIQSFLPLLKSMEQANLNNQIYINSQFNQEYHENLSSKLSKQIYIFAQQKYKFQKYYRRILEILITQLEDSNGLYFQSQQQYLKGRQNLQTLKERLKQVIYNHDPNNFGENLANVKTDQEYHYPKAIYHFPFYKNPTPTLCLLFSSPIVLCVINLFIFFQQMGLNDRLASTTALMICFIGMVAIMQKQIHSSTLSTFQFLIYGMMLTPLLCLASSLYCFLNHIEPTWEYVMKSYLFWLSVLISLLGLLFPTIFLFIYWCYEKKIYQNNQNVQKQMEPLFLLFPGSPQVDKIIAKQQRLEQVEYDDDYSPINVHKKQGSRKTLQRVVTSLMFKHLNSLYELRKTNENAEREIKLAKRLYQQIRSKKKFIKNTFEIPKFERNKYNLQNMESSTQIWDSPIKEKKTKHQQIMQEMFKFAYQLKH